MTVNMPRSACIVHKLTTINLPNLFKEEVVTWFALKRIVKNCGEKGKYSSYLQDCKWWLLHSRLDREQARLQHYTSWQLSGTAAPRGRGHYWRQRFHHQGYGIESKGWQVEAMHSTISQANQWALGVGNHGREKRNPVMTTTLSSFPSPYFLPLSTSFSLSLSLKPLLSLSLSLQILKQSTESSSALSNPWCSSANQNSPPKTADSSWAPATILQLCTPNQTENVGAFITSRREANEREREREAKKLPRPSSSERCKPRDNLHD